MSRQRENCIYKSSEDLVTKLKETFRPYRKIIKSNTEKNKRLPFVTLKRISTLDRCVAYYQQNDNQYDERLDRKLTKILRKSEEQKVSAEEQPLKKRKIVNSLLDLNLINDENEDLDFEEENTQSSQLSEAIEEDESEPSTADTYSEPKLTNVNSNKVNGLVRKSDYQKTNGSVNYSERNGNTLGLTKPTVSENGFISEVSKALPADNGFKIPKKSSQSIETIIEHSQRLANNNIRPVEAYKHLARYLSEDQWRREDVMQLLVTISKNMVSNKDFGINVSIFNELIDKMKSLKYVDEDFWDEIIYLVEKKRSDSKNTQVSLTFIASIFLISELTAN